MRRVREHDAKAKEVELLEKALRAEKKTNAKVKASVPVGGAELSTQLNSTPTGDGTSGKRSAQPAEGAAGVNDGARDEEKVRGATRKCWRCGQMGRLSRDCTMTEQEGRDRLRAEAGTTRDRDPLDL